MEVPDLVSDGGVFYQKISQIRSCNLDEVFCTF